jgi:hypothetical protein
MRDDPDVVRARVVEVALDELCPSTGIVGRIQVWRHTFALLFGSLQAA